MQLPADNPLNALLSSEEGTDELKTLDFARARKIARHADIAGAIDTILTAITINAENLR